MNKSFCKVPVVVVIGLVVLVLSWYITTTCNSLSQEYTNLDDHISQTSIDTPRFNPSTLLCSLLLII